MNTYPSRKPLDINLSSKMLCQTPSTLVEYFLFKYFLVKRFLVKCFSAIAMIIFSLLFAAGCQAEANENKKAVLEIHKNILKSFLTKDVDMLFSHVAQRCYEIKDGTIEWNEKHDLINLQRSMMEQYDYSIYEDISEPIIRVSDDGTLGWLVAEVRIRGHEYQPDGTRSPFLTIAAWIELYEKRDEKWLIVGSTSTTQSEP